MAKRLICIAVINSHAWEIYGVRGTGGVSCWSSDGVKFHTPYIDLGLDTSLHDLMSTLVHEVGEIALNEMQCAYDPSHTFRQTNATIHFILDHEQWDEASCAIGYAMTTLYPIVKKAHRERVKSITGAKK